MWTSATTTSSSWRGPDERYGSTAPRASVAPLALVVARVVSRVPTLPPKGSGDLDEYSEVPHPPRPRSFGVVAQDPTGRATDQQGHRAER